MYGYRFYGTEGLGLGYGECSGLLLGSLPAVPEQNLNGGLSCQYKALREQEPQFSNPCIRKGPCIGGVQGPRNLSLGEPVKFSEPPFGLRRPRHSRHQRKIRGICTEKRSPSQSTSRNLLKPATPWRLAIIKPCGFERFNAPHPKPFEALNPKSMGIVNPNSHSSSHMGVSPNQGHHFEGPNNKD